MTLAGRLPLLAVLAALLLAGPAVVGASADGGSCTTALGPQLDRLTDAPTAAGCAQAILIVTPNPVDPGAEVTLDGSQSVGGDTGSEIAHYNWDFGDGTTDQTFPESIVRHTYARGVYTARLQLLDALNATLDATSVDIVVSALPVATIRAPSGTLRPGVAYDFDATGSTAPGSATISYQWDWGDGTTSQTAGPTTQHVFAGDGASRQVSVTVVNDLRLASAPASAPVDVANQLPLVQLIATPATVQTGQQLTLDATGSSDPDGAIAEYRWDLDANGSFETSSGTSPVVTAGGYPNPGVITLRVKVIDDNGGASTKGVPVTVARPPATGGGSSGGGSGGGSGSGSGGSGGGTGGSSGGGSGSGSGGSGSGASGGAGGSAGDPFAVGLSGAAIQRLKAALQRGVGLQAVANRAATGTLTMTLAPADARKLHLRVRGKRPLAIGTLRLSLRAGRTAKPAIKLTRAAASALRRAKPRTLRVTIRGSLVAGTASAAVVRVVLLRS